MPPSALIKGNFTSALAILIALIFAVPILVLVLLKLLVPGLRAKRRVTLALAFAAELWAQIYKKAYCAIHRPKWQVEMPEDLNRTSSYLAISNHQSWADIAILVVLLTGKVPFFRFLMKRQLIWLPVIGAMAWGLDCPMLRRYGKTQLQRNPQLRARDANTLARFCQSLGQSPATIVNYVEGTRFTPQKHREQESPYRFLLQPRIGGVASIIGHLGDQVAEVLDITLVYPSSGAGFWGFLCGRTDGLIVRIEKKPIPEDLINTDYRESELVRESYRLWLESIWQEKDTFITSIHEQASGAGKRRDAS